MIDGILCRCGKDISKEVTMKKVRWGLVVAILAASLVVLAVGTNFDIVKSSPASMSEASPTVMVANPILELSSGTQVVIMGSGFEPGQELRLLVHTLNRGNKMTDEIGWALTEDPLVADELGAWITVFTPGRLISKKIITEGVYSITATDNEYTPLAYTAVAFYDASKPVEEWSDWAKVVGEAEE